MRLGALFVAAILLATPFASQAKPLPLSDWIRWPQFKNVVISPDGKHLAVISAVPKHPQRYQLAIIDTQSVVKKKPKVRSSFSLQDYQLFAGVTWVNNERLVASTAYQQGGFAKPFGTGDLLATNVDGSHNGKLMGMKRGTAFLGILNLLPDNPRAIEVIGRGRSAQPIAYWLDVYTGKMHKVSQSPLPNGGLMADHNGDVRLAYGASEKTGEGKLYYRKADSMDWLNKSDLVDFKTSVAELSNGGPKMFGPDNKYVYVLNWANNAAETLSLYTYNFNTGDKKLLYANPHSDVTGLIRSFDKKSIVGVNIMPGKPQTLALDPKSAHMQLLAALSQALPNVQVGLTSWSRDGSEAIVRTWGNAVSPAYYLYASKPKPSLTFLFNAVPWISSKNLSKMKPISFKSRDGLTINGYLTLPHGVKPKDLPMVVYVHGGPHGIRTDWGYSPSNFDSVAEQILADHGYAVLSLNYRGSGGYGYKFLVDGFRHWGDTMQNDLADGVKWAIKQGYADPRRVCIFGASYGGYAAVMNPERFPDMYRCAVGYDGCYDLIIDKTRASDTSRVAAGRLYLDMVLGSNTEQLKAFSPAYNADKLKIPVFLLHGGRDVRCPVEGYEHMVAAIKKNGTPLKTLFEKNEGHGFYKPAHRKKAWQEMLAFFGKYIGPDAAH